ncbi:MAG: type II toxin-antitoxin system VapC family toxin [Armatimonadota bacterium]
MPLTIVLDTSPLSIVTQRAGVAEAEACRRWLAECRRANCRILAPAIAYYEVARELRRSGRDTGLARLEAFCALPGCYLPLTDTALRLAASLWASARNSGRPTADPKELDCDVLLAAQALDLGLRPEELVIATSNIGHLSQFVRAELWSDIRPDA